MASWALLEAAAGYQYDAPQGRLTFAPWINPDDFCGFFVTGSGWGTFSRKGGTARLCVNYGSLSLKELRLKSSAAPATVRLGEQTIAADAEQIDGDYMRLRFAQPMTIAAGEMLTVTSG
jgi:hypothetical protein